MNRAFIACTVPSGSTVRLSSVPSTRKSSSCASRRQSSWQDIHRRFSAASDQAANTRSTGAASDALDDEGGMGRAVIAVSA